MGRSKAEALEPEGLEAYLRRLDHRGSRAPTLPTLEALHRSHLLRVPFEDLDIHLGRPIRLDLASLLAKVVAGRRGGYCYELNGLFAALLRTLGFEVQLLSARVARPDGGYAPDFDHLTLRVTSGELEGPWLADVGFGDAFLAPLPLSPGFTRREGRKTLGLWGPGEAWVYWEDRGEGARPQYAFDLVPRELAEFEPMNTWQQASPESHFRRNRLCTLATPGGRVTLSGSKLITRDGEARTERLVEEAEVADLLRVRFGVELPGG